MTTSRHCLILSLCLMTAGCGRWAIDRQDERAAELIDARLPAGMTLQEFGREFPAAQAFDSADGQTTYLVTAQQICFWCKSKRGFVRSVDTFARVATFENEVLVRVEPAREAAPQ